VSKVEEEGRGAIVGFLISDVSSGNTYAPEEGYLQYNARD
jgi:hypothetical protein